MAKEPKEIILTDEQKNINSTLSEDLSAEYMQTIVIVQKLRKRRVRLNIKETNLLLNFYESDKFDESTKKSIGFGNKQRSRLIKSVKKIGYSDYATRVATQPLITTTANKSLTKLVKKDNDMSLEYAITYHKSHVGMENVNWCYDMVLSPVKKNLKSKNPLHQSYRRIANFIYETNSVGIIDGEDVFRPDLYDAYIKRTFADRLFGKDEEINKMKNTKKRDVLIHRKQNFIQTVKKALEEQHDIHQIAKLDSAEEDAFMASIDSKTKEYIEAKVNEKFNEKYKDDFSHANAILEDIKKRHPKDYEEYLNKLRNTKEYQKAYAKYTKEYSEARANLRGEVIKEVKSASSISARSEVFGADSTLSETEEETLDK